MLYLGVRVQQREGDDGGGLERLRRLVHHQRVEARAASACRQRQSREHGGAGEHGSVGLLSCCGVRWGPWS